jgi:hypothetical protein
MPEADTHTFTFDVVSPKFGAFTVIAPLRFMAEVQARTWSVRRDPKRAKGREFFVSTHERVNNRDTSLPADRALAPESKATP